MKDHTCNSLLRMASRPDFRRTIADLSSQRTFNVDGCDLEAVHLLCGAVILTWLVLSPITRCHFAFNPSEHVFRTSISLFSYTPPFFKQPITNTWERRHRQHFIAPKRKQSKDNKTVMQLGACQLASRYYLQLACSHHPAIFLSAQIVHTVFSRAFQCERTLRKFLASIQSRSVRF